jgi:non-ribosomal peptide synthetase component F
MVLPQKDQILQFSSICFDASVEEIFVSLLSGATLVLRTEEMLRSSEDFWQCCQKWQLTVLGIPTAYWHQLASELTPDTLPILSKIKLIVIGGEAIQPAKVQQWQTVTGKYSPLPRLLNAYEANGSNHCGELFANLLHQIPPMFPLDDPSVILRFIFLMLAYNLFLWG